jgi:hypothetical protein
MASSTDVSNKINVRGLINSALKKGFSVRDCLSEFLDNVLDAGGKHCFVQHFLRGHPLSNSHQSYMVVSDDAGGMSIGVADSCLTIHNEKTPSADKNGFAGIGMSTAMSNLAQLKDISLILSKQRNGDIVQVAINFTQWCENGSWNPVAHDVSAKNLYLWEKYAINKEHGTVIILALDQHISNELIAKADVIYDDFAKTYASYPEFVIRLKLTDAEPVVVEYVDVLDKENVSEDEYYSTHIEVFRNDSETRVYYLNGNSQMARINFADIKGAKLLDYPPSEGYSKVCEFELEHSYMPDKGEDTSARKQGATYFQRERKIISSITNPSITSGDLDKRKVLEFTNHRVNYDFSGDNVFKTQMNKSKLSSDNIDNAVWKTIEFLKSYWCDKYIKAHKLKKSRGPKDPRGLLVKKVDKMVMNDDKFFTELSAYVSKYEADNSQP